MFKHLIVLSLLFLFPLNSLCAAEVSEKEEAYGPEYFYAIEGEVYGQAAPGVQAVYINGKAVKTDKDLNFRTKVFLKEGEKYLTIETQYRGLRFIKKYLVVRHPKVKTPFKMEVPIKEFQEIIKKQPIPVKKKEEPKKEVIKKIVPVPGYEFVAELEKEKFLAVRKVNGKYFAQIYDLTSKIWFPLQEISLQEMKDLLEKGAIPPSFDP